MKKYIITALFILTPLAGSTRFQPGDEKAVPFPECGSDYNCYYQKLGEEEKLEIEKQEEEQELREFEIQNRRVEELKENAEQPGLNP